ncbi:hypothetical protein C8F01DRAFT_1338686 [Mycena amicta]|nr:hypothetical protein C8F01DRAFT_1338686 [Mycena amicta]
MTTPTLFTPLKLGSTTIPNRVGMSALTRSRATKTVPNDIMREYYVQRAQGGAGLIVTDGVLITRQGTEWQEAPGLWDKPHIDGWKTIVEAVHATGSKIYAQLWHLGRVSHPDAPEQIAAGVPVYGPSAISARGGKFLLSMESPDMLLCVSVFIPSLSSYDSAAEDDILSPTGGYNDVGMPLADTIETFGHLLQQIEQLPTPLAYVVLARYNPFLDAEFDGKPRATQHDVLETFKSYLPTGGRTPLFLNSGLTPPEAEALIGSGAVAGVFFGVPWLTHPDLGKRITAGNLKPLDNAPDFANFYGAEGVDPALGYTDYKAAVY